MQRKPSGCDYDSSFWTSLSHGEFVPQVPLTAGVPGKCSVAQLLWGRHSVGISPRLHHAPPVPGAPTVPVEASQPELVCHCCCVSLFLYRYTTPPKKGISRTQKGLIKALEESV